jgi:hypothetical protein
VTSVLAGAAKALVVVGLAVLGLAALAAAVRA